ncbi:MAG TPA: SRPBCC family protein [Candidatus Polarisedimenticolia bacterium]|nr:SRPBCC family protein [Candidatus Polarisedimenticolia bacterium]
MLVLVTATLICGGLAIALLARLRAIRVVSSTRSVLLHVPIDRAWEMVRDFPALFAAHGRGRPLLSVQASTLEQGDGHTSRSVWRQRGTWGRHPYSARIEILEVEAPTALAVRFVGDNLRSERGLLRHRGELRLRAEGERSTKVTWQLSARIHSLPMLFARLLAPERVEARLLDLSLRSLKAAVDGGTRPAGAGHVPAFPLPARGSAAAPPIASVMPSPEPLETQPAP